MQTDAPIENISNRVMGKRVLLAASTGGHLAQLHRFASQFTGVDVAWITFDTPQSRSLLGEPSEKVTYVDYVAPRDWRGVARVYSQVRTRLRDDHFDLAISTGAALAVSVLGAARSRGIETIYVESVSRVSGPSLSGKIVKKLRLAETFTQHRSWASDAWPLHESVLASFRAEPRENPVSRDRARVFVTLGTIRPYRFDSAVEAIKLAGFDTVGTTWQLGETTRSDLTGPTSQLIEGASFREEALAADVVVTHAGVGTILQLLEWGIHPIVIPRRAERQEHVDNHQLQIAEYLRERGLALVRESGELSAQDFDDALTLMTVAANG